MMVIGTVWQARGWGDEGLWGRGCSEVQAGRPLRLSALLYAVYTRNQ